jgi:hypothetical protein
VRLRRRSFCFTDPHAHGMPLQHVIALSGWSVAPNLLCVAHRIASSPHHTHTHTHTYTRIRAHRRLWPPPSVPPPARPWTPTPCSRATRALSPTQSTRGWDVSWGLGCGGG